MALPGPLAAAEVDRWVARQLQHAPGRLSEGQRRVIRAALAQGSADGLDAEHDQQEAATTPGPAGERRAG